MTEATRRTPGTPCWVSLMVHGMATTQEFNRAFYSREFRFVFGGAELSEISKIRTQQNVCSWIGRRTAKIMN